MPIMAMPESADAALAAAIVRRPHSFSEIIGSGERRSWITNTIVETIAIAVSAAISRTPAEEIAVRSAMTAVIASANAPALRWSIRPSLRSTFSCRKRANIAAATAPSGRLSQKIQAQEKCWMMRPPASGPSTAESAQTLAR